MKSPHQLFLASAGTGKTFRLSNRYIQLIAAGAQPCSILATTFTRKAAGEILERVLGRLAEAATDPEKLEELRQHVDPALTRERCRDLTVLLAGQMNRLNIGTIDSFFSRMLRGFGLELGVPPAWDMLDDESDDDLRAAAVQLTLSSPDLNPERVTTLVRMLSSGGLKRSVCQLILDAIKAAYAAYAGADPAAWETFGPDGPPPTDEDASVLVRAVRAIRPPLTKAGTPAQHWVSNLANIADAVGAHAWREALKSGLLSCLDSGADTFSQQAITADVRDALTPVITAAQRAILQQLKDRNLAVRDLMFHFDRAYRELKSSRSVLRFDDVPRLLLSAAASSRLDDLYFRLDGRIDHLLLDEFQDTSLDQFEILKPIMDELLSQGDEFASRSVLCVGDVKQSLYSWRGGEPELLPALKTRWPQFEMKPLAVNRRSSPVILEAVNRVFENIGSSRLLQERAPRAIKSWQDQFEHHEAHEKVLPGEAVLVVYPKLVQPDEADSMDESGTAHTDPSEDGQSPEEEDRNTQRARFVAERVKTLRSTAPHASIAVLTRTNAPIAQLIFEIREAGHAAIGEHGNPLTDSPAASIAISALHLADHPGDSAAYFHVATSLLGRILGLPPVPEETPDGSAIAARLRLGIARRGLAGTLARFQKRLAPHIDASGFARFDQLIALAEEYETTATDPIRPGDFARLARNRAIEPPDHNLGDADPVRVMTIHKAKGLEFDAVILPELDREWRLQPNGVLIDRRDERGHCDPLSRIAAITMYPNSELQSADAELADLHARTLDKQISEELSSLYVAMTRPRRYLEMIIHPPRPRASSGPTAAKVLCEVLAPDASREPGSTAWSSASSTRPWHAGITGRQRPVPPESVEIRFAPETAIPTSHLERRSPSSLEGGPRIDLGELWKSSPARPDSDLGARAKDRGTAFHTMFEQIEWLDDGIPSESDLIQVTKRAGVFSPEAQAWVQEFRALLTLSEGESREGRSRLSRALYQTPTLFPAAPENPVSASLLRSRYANRPGTLQVRREWGFALRVPGDSPCLLNGQFDRVVFGVEGSKPVWAEVLDFKTDNIAPGDEESLRSSIEHYRPQLEAYKLAAASLLRLAPLQVSAGLIFCGPRRVVPV